MLSRMQVQYLCMFQRVSAWHSMQTYTITHIPLPPSHTHTQQFKKKNSLKWPKTLGNTLTHTRAREHAHTHTHFLDVSFSRSKSFFYSFFWSALVSCLYRTVSGDPLDQVFIYLLGNPSNNNKQQQTHTQTCTLLHTHMHAHTNANLHKDTYTHIFRVNVVLTKGIQPSVWDKFPWVK